MAAGVSFYTLLAVFPGIAAFVALYGLFAAVADAQRHLWNWLTNVVILAGAELNAEIAAEAIGDTTMDKTRPMGIEGADVGDKRGPAQIVSRAVSLIPVWPGGAPHLR